MPKGFHSSLIRTIHETTGLTAGEFASQKLNMKVSTFNYKVRQGTWTRDEYKVILEATGKTWEELFGTVSSPAPVKVKEEKKEAPPVSAPSKVEVEKLEKEKEPVSAPFVVEEIDLPLPSVKLPDF
jgi:hypothetical protein